MYEKLITCAAKIMLCILKRLKTGFKIHNCISHTHEMKNNILSKIKGACSSFFQKYIDCQKITRCLPKKFFLLNMGGNFPLSPASYAYGHSRKRFIFYCNAMARVG